MADDIVSLDPFARFRAATRARIGLGRSGDSLPTAALLDFQLSHAKARDAVHGAVDWDALEQQMPRPAIRVKSAVPDRSTYLRRPDLGRRLDPASASGLVKGAWDVVLIVGDGLSAAAVQNWAVQVVWAVHMRLSGLSIAPLVLAEQARVALSDPIGAALGAKLAVMLIGERPGLSVADSLGIYMTYGPRSGRRDADRNCLSNIHAHGLSPAAAADKLVWLITQSLRRGLSGVGLKEETPSLQPGQGSTPGQISISSD
ncbi:ethanolamine ammonia-lyase subunit EutC [Magnetospirillum sulfuroxidans]|uniref:Ethanolamine ammonia-lyase small subunit n=1 Tax=Magnetospirillum sulfuroxidans TaxID=611300 RepID=A0ABS5IBW1_9PROT|nr:ethanolamine ammonia-lyase subunit EutC [Magnetospirillum sulfuroxidans]MBR9971916.1 ethanolamine ammonia-lyase subunit EutC [Magnetospirillum sulfuroxidans]